MNSDDKKPLVYMILWGVVRHGLALAGMWLESHGLIDSQTHQRLLSEGVTEFVGYALMFASVAWSVLQKTQVWEWVKKSLHLPSVTTPAQALKATPGPDIPI
jgi:hypothetical protein